MRSRRLAVNYVVTEGSFTSGGPRTVRTFLGRCGTSIRGTGDSVRNATTLYRGCAVISPTTITGGTVPLYGVICRSNGAVGAGLSTCLGFLFSTGPGDMNNGLPASSFCCRG